MLSLSPNPSLSAILLTVNPPVRCNISLSVIRGQIHVSKDRIKNDIEFKETVKLSYLSISPAAFTLLILSSWYTASVAVQMANSYRRRDEHALISSRPGSAVQGGCDSNGYWTANTLTPSFRSSIPPSPRSVLFSLLPSNDSTPSGWSDKIRFWIEMRISKMMLWKISPHYFILLMSLSPAFNSTVFVAATQCFLSLL